jgi:magnesium transporter
VFRILAVRTKHHDELIVDAPLERLAPLLAERGTRVWVDMGSPLGDNERAIVHDVFKFHPLAIEDCFEERTHPKVDEYDGYLYIITHGLTAGATADSSEIVELDAFLGDNFLVTHHSAPSRSVATVLGFVERTGLPLRHSVTAVLHAILDRQADGLEAALDNIESRIDVLEDAVFASPRNTHVASVLSVKRNILELRRWTARQREVLLRLGRREFELIPASDALLFRDVHDHLVRVSDLLEGFRDMLTSIQEAYLSAVSNRTNEIMKFLTLFTSTMMPLTVITGIYGMNFEHMPELKWWFGYPSVLIAMAVMTGSIMVYFRHRRWLGRPPKLDDASGEDQPDEGGR